MNQFVRIYLLPGAIFQSVIIAGGYGTGREVVEYFASKGLVSGILGLLTAGVCFALIFAASLEISRVFKVYDYRNFFKVLLGRGWFVYEILGVMLFMLVVAVIGSAAGEVMSNELGLHPMVGVAIMLFTVTFLVFYGREVVTRLLAYWSLFLYLVFISYLVAVFIKLPDLVVAGFDASEDEGGWAVRGAQYSFYNVTAIPIILYCAMAIETRTQAISAGVIGALIAIIPGLMLHISFAAHYPAILEEPLPIYAIFSMLDIDILKFAYLVMLFGTFIETGAGNLQGFMERLDGWWREKYERALSQTTHAAIAATAMLLAGGLSHLGIITLIAEGYGTLAWGFLFVYVIPLLTFGIYKLYKAER